jgi:RNA recognition motif-containing protein
MATKLHIGQLHDSTTADDLSAVLGRFGHVKKVDMKQGYAFAGYDDPRDAADAVQALNDTELGGSQITVGYVTDKKGVKTLNNRPIPKKNDAFRVFVYGLTEAVTWRELKDIGRQFGFAKYSDRNVNYGVIDMEVRLSLGFGDACWCVVA